MIYVINELVSGKKFTNGRSLLSSGLLSPGSTVELSWKKNTFILLYFRFSNHCTCCCILQTEKIRYLTFNLSAPDNATVWSILANRHSVKEWISSSFFCAGHDKKEKTACVEIQQTPQKQFYWCHRAHRQIWKSIVSYLAAGCLRRRSPRSQYYSSSSDVFYQKPASFIIQGLLRLKQSLDYHIIV